MNHQFIDWQSKGFGQEPVLRVSGNEGLLLYRCWGNRSAEVGSTEWGTGFFALEKPISVSEAETRFNIVDWNNGVHFVSTFRLKKGFPYWIGPVAHGFLDVHLLGYQVFVATPLNVKLSLITSRELLRHDFFVSPKDGNA